MSNGKFSGDTKSIVEELGQKVMTRLSKNTGKAEPVGSGNLSSGESFGSSAVGAEMVIMFLYIFKVGNMILIELKHYYK